MVTRILLCICALSFAASAQIPAIEPGVSQELAKWRATQYSNISYKLNLTLEKMSPVLRGSMEIHVTQAAYACDEQNCPPLYVVLDWRKISGHENDSTIKGITINEKAANLVRSSTLELPRWRRPKSVFECFEIADHLVFNEGVVMGENVIKLDFTSPILTSGSAITRYVDKEDGAEYIYSLFVPSDASTAFPVFDQPDLKARFTLDVLASNDWKVISNGVEEENRIKATETQMVEKQVKIQQGVSWVRFRETKPISTYVFAFAAGPFAAFTSESAPGATGGAVDFKKNGLDCFIQSGRISCVDPKYPGNVDPIFRFGPPRPEPEVVSYIQPNIYVRKSQSDKFIPHANEVFRLQLEAIKYLETYFDYKFPFPKYDLVLIPEFPFGGMEHAGATFLREQSVIFPQEPTRNDIISRANLIFHEAAHQWFGDCVTMKWFDDLWLKEGFAEFMAYKTLEKVMPEANAWKVFYERNKQAAYATDSTKGTTPIYQPIANLNSAKSAYGNIVYRKAPSFLRQAEFYLGEDKFQTAVRAFLKKHEFANATWQDLVKEFETASGQDLKEWANAWVKNPGVPFTTSTFCALKPKKLSPPLITSLNVQEVFAQQPFSLLRPNMDKPWGMKFNMLVAYSDGKREALPFEFSTGTASGYDQYVNDRKPILFIFPNYQDFGYGIFLLDDKSRDYVLKNIQNEKDDFLRTMMWGSLWDSVREAELDPRDYVELVIKNIGLEKDEGTVQTLLSRVTTAMNYYMSEPPAVAGGLTQKTRNINEQNSRKSAALNNHLQPPATAGGTDLQARLEALLIDKIQNASTQGQRITYYRAFLNIASTDKSRGILKKILSQSVPPAVAGGLTQQTRTKNEQGSVQTKTSNDLQPPATAGGSDMRLKTKDKFDIVTRLAILGDADAPKLLADLEKTETSDDAKRYAYAAHAAFATAENKQKFFLDFIGGGVNESWIESAIVPFNSVRHADLTQRYLGPALVELPKLKRSRKIFFVNNWLAAFIGGQRDQNALNIINMVLAANPTLDNDLRLKILENSDLIERAIKIRAKYGKN